MEVGASNKKGCVLRVQKRSEILQAMGSEDRKIILSRDVNFNESFIMKTLSSQ